MDIAARYGGEEFVLVWFSSEGSSCETMASLVVKAMAQLAIPHARSDTCDYVTVSGGICCCVPTDEASHDFVAIADAALYKAKEQGRNQVVIAD